MAKEQKKSNETPSGELVETTADIPKSVVLAGAKADGLRHFDIAVIVEASGKQSSLVISDAGKGPVFITKPIRIEGKNLQAFLKNKDIELPGEITRLLSDTTISCEAFYYTKEGAQVMVFTVKFDKGLISSLTGDEDLGALFDVKGAAVRMISCPEKDFDILKQYVAGLEE